MGKPFHKLWISLYGTQTGLIAYPDMTLLKPGLGTHLDLAGRRPSSRCHKSTVSNESTRIRIASRQAGFGMARISHSFSHG